MIYIATGFCFLMLCVMVGFAVREHVRQTRAERKRSDD